MTPSVAIVKLLLLEGTTLEKVEGDPGGLTKNGVTQVAYNSYRTGKGLPAQSVALMSDAEMDDIYTGQYWNLAGCPLLPDGLDFVHFQWAVNHGTDSATRCLKLAIFHRPQDSDLDGPLTSSDTGWIQVWGNLALVVERYLAIQSSTYDRLEQENQSEVQFFDGWENRIQRVRDILAGKPFSC